MPKTKTNYKIVSSDGAIEEFDSPSDGAALSKCLTRALAADHAGTWELSFKGDRVDELLNVVKRDDTGDVEVLTDAVS